MVYIYFDGGLIEMEDGSRIGACGAYIQRREKVYQFSKVIDGVADLSVLQTEYYGLIGALKVYHKMVETGRVDADEPVAIRGDSKMVCDVIGKYYPSDEFILRNSKYARLRPYAVEARALYVKVKVATIEWVPRKENRRADALCNRALGEYRKEKGIKLSYANRKGVKLLKHPPGQPDAPVMKRPRPVYHVETNWQKMARELGYKGSYRGDPRCGNYIPEKFRPLFGDIISEWNKLPPGCTCGLCGVPRNESTTEASQVPGGAGLGAKPLPALARRASLDEEW